MKNLLLLRHAKSSWHNSDLADFDRPLNKRGLEAAPLAGCLIFNRKIPVDLILSSPAKRARQTAILARETAQIKSQIYYEEKIYEASPLALLALLAEQEDMIASILLVGHNPGLESLAEILTGENITMRTAMLARINLNVESWRDIKPGCGKLKFVSSPYEAEDAVTD